jgi:hypothetical protein
MDEEEIKVVNLPVGKLLAGYGLNLVLVVESLPQLGDDEELLTLYETLLDGAGNALTTLLLVAIVCVSGRGNISADVASMTSSIPTKRKRGKKVLLFSINIQHEPGLTTCAIKQTVTGLDGVVHGICGRCVVDLPEAKAHLGHFIAAVELNCWRHLAC